MSVEDEELELLILNRRADELGSLGSLLLYYYAQASFLSFSSMHAMHAMLPSRCYIRVHIDKALRRAAPAGTGQLHANTSAYSPSGELRLLGWLRG